jgi:hypothetical protein
MSDCGSTARVNREGGKEKMLIPNDLRRLYTSTLDNVERRVERIINVDFSIASIG